MPRPRAVNPPKKLITSISGVYPSTGTRPSDHATKTVTLATRAAVVPAAPRNNSALIGRSVKLKMLSSA